MHRYTDDFYTTYRDGSRRSAQEIIPLVLALTRPQRVVDVGCGVGTWLSVVSEHGVADVLGIDGDYVNRQLLMIPAERFLPLDLKQPVRVADQFDLVISLEVAEHLPVECAEIFVESLTRLGPAVLFSAAIPHQAGADHVNEQWQDYWARHFAARGYLPVDCVRPQVWDNRDVNVEYAQNTLLYATREYIASRPALERHFERTDSTQLALVHPRQYLLRVEGLQALLVPESWSLKHALSVLPALLVNAVKNKLRLNNGKQIYADNAPKAQ